MAKVELKLPDATTRVPESGRSGWTIETAIDYLLAIINEKHAQLTLVIVGNDRRYEERFDASQQALELGLSAQKTEVSAALAASDRAVTKAEVAAEKRFEGVNEFRAQLGDQQRTLMPRQEVAVIATGLQDRIGAVESSLSNKINALEKQLDAVGKQLDTMHAERAGIKGGWGYAVGLIGAILTLGSLIALGARLVGNSGP